MKKLSIAMALVLVVAMALPAMAAEVKVNDKTVNISGEVEVEQTDNDNDNTAAYGTDDTLETTLTLYIDSQLSEKVSVFSTLEIADNNDRADNDDFSIEEAGVDVKDVFGPIGLKAGRMELVSTDGMLYDYDEIDADSNFATFYYEEGNVNASISNSLDDDTTDSTATNNDIGSATVAKFGATDLELIDSFDIDYMDLGTVNNAGTIYEDVTGYTLKGTKDFGVVDTALIFGNVDSDNSFDSADVAKLDLSTDQLFPGVTLSLNYADVEEGYTTLAGFQDNEIGDSDRVNGLDFDMIKPGINFDITDKLNVDFSYAMYDADDVDNEDDYTDLVFAYDMATNTTLELEYENHDYDTGNDNDTITTTLTTKF
ncbi:hypothetical protein [Sporohalobacter salinus]|uniref:hypothetical protein n=1 Tax=Sporohalobacter salinus TaxID=1494606 RepID=UPI00196174B6|nr:hypothetical protein [Sporohalobacter salinus]MBM7623332.1 hypothetical protein [Sporohalobacter salinus]